MAFLLFELTFN